jgi:hypothetical protein
MGEEERVLEIANLAAHGDATGRGGQQGLGGLHRRFGARDVGAAQVHQVGPSAAQ